MSIKVVGNLRGYFRIISIDIANKMFCFKFVYSFFQVFVYSLSMFSTSFSSSKAAVTERKGCLRLNLSAVKFVTETPKLNKSFALASSFHSQLNL